MGHPSIERVAVRLIFPHLRLLLTAPRRRTGLINREGLIHFRRGITGAQRITVSAKHHLLTRLVRRFGVSVVSPETDVSHLTRCATPGVCDLRANFLLESVLAKALADSRMP